MFKYQINKRLQNRSVVKSPVFLHAVFIVSLQDGYIGCYHL